MGQSQSQTSIQEQYDIIKLRQDGSALLQHKKSQEQFLLRTVSSNIGQQVSTFQELLRKRQQIKSPHLLDLIQIRRKQQKNVCSSAHKMYLLIEYPFKTLKDEIVDKISKPKVVPFLQAELWSILYSCCMGLNTLYERKMPHESMTTEQIFINKEGLVKISDPILLGTQKNYIKVLKNNNQHCIISPEIINFLDDCNFSFYDKEKSDVFILGAIMVEASLLHPIQLFDQVTKRPLLQTIPKSLNQIKQKYSPTFANVLQKMMQLHSKLRPRFAEIITTIEQDNNLYESTDQTSVQNRTRTNNSFSKLNEGSSKTLTKSNQNPNLIVNKNGQSLNMRPTNSKPESLGFKQSYNKNIKQNNDQTIIKMLQTQNLSKADNQRVYYAPQSGVSVFNQQVQQPTYLYSNTKPFAFGNPQIVSQNYNIQQPNFNTNNFYHNNNMHNSNNNSQVRTQESSARFNQTHDRFSYTKFGNISLDNPNLKKQKPIFSYQIPSINQILKNQPFARQEKNIAQQVTYAKPLNPQIQNKPIYQATSQAVPQNIPNSQPFYVKPFQSQSLTRSPPNIKQPSQQQDEMKMKSGNKNEKVSQQKNQQLNLDRYVDQSSPIKLKNAGVKTNQAPNINNKISLNGILKENQQKKNEIFAVTQKSQQHLETSPAKNIVSSIVKLNQPQRSPGPSSSNFNSHIKSNSQIQNQISQSQYVIQILDGGGRYEGYFKNGQKNGEGRLQFNDGGFYAGEWKDNKMHGHGKLHYQNGQVAYQGNWQNDQFSGFGRVFNDRPEKIIGTFNYHDFADLGQKWIYYEGQFKNDSKHGKGKIRLTNGQVFEGNFIYDSIEGDGTFYTIKGQAIRGTWKDNMLI